jgi:hypothetical protein
VANPSNLFRRDGRLNELVRHIRPWSDDIRGKLGLDARSLSVSSDLASQHLRGDGTI